jgi:hypothetical protein
MGMTNQNPRGPTSATLTSMTVIIATCKRLSVYFAWLQVGT